jgi:hypothetical protein
VAAGASGVVVALAGGLVDNRKEARMTRTLMLTVGAACLATAGLLAQATTAGSKSSTADRITATGCVEQASQAMPAGSAAASTDVGSQDFVLVKPGASSTGSTSSSTASSTAANRMADSNVMYRLSSLDHAKLAPHVGHKVEITGESSASAAGGKPTTGGSVGTTGSNPPSLTVDSVKMISTTCTE